MTQCKPKAAGHESSPMRGFLAKDKKPDHIQMPSPYRSPARAARRSMRRPIPSTTNRALHKWKSGVDPSGFWKRHMYSPKIKMYTPNHVRILAAEALRARQIASAKKRRANLARALKVALKFRPRTPKKKPYRRLFPKK